MAYELLAPVASIAALLFAAFSTWRVLKRETGTARMNDISRAIRDGATAYMRKQYVTIAILVALSAIALGLALGAFTSLAFVAGAICSALAGYIGMAVAVRANVRTAQAARSSLGEALGVAFQGGAVMGMMVVGLALLGIYLLYLASGDPFKIVGFGVGASLVGLFARVGGGIYTKAADMGADLVGKIEVGIPEDDPRNPGVIADLVGDNVGDVAGMGADLFESNVGSILAAMLIGVIGAREYGREGVVFPLALQAVGILATILGVLLVRALKGIKPQLAINGGMFASGVLATIAACFLAQRMFGGLNVFYAALSGIVAALLVGLITQYYTSSDKPPVREIAKSSQTGSGTTILAGLAMGMTGTAFPIAIVCGAIFLAHKFAGVYGVAIATVGMQSITGIIVAMDAFGPIVDNASGITEMAGLGPEVRRTTDALDSVGNTTKAVCKGFAIGDAGSETVALFLVYMLHAHIETVLLTDLPVITGLFIGGILPFVFSGLCLRAVGKTAFKMIEEIRRQFREIPGLKKGEARPDYARCVDISTTAALRNLLAPGLMAVATPLILGFTLGPEAVGGLLIGCIVTAFPMAIFMAYAGTAWDNAKKFIEEGHLGGKGSLAHHAAVIGDTVGDPFKDTAGPSLDVLMTILTTVSILFAPLFLRRL
jgi:K(+)-stimulated pyrophosphate-energized sodium pump